MLAPNGEERPPRRALGAHGPELSLVGLGGWEAGGGRTWGANASDAAVVDALRSGWDAGVNWVDTAEVYARGGSERIVGRALRGHDDVRVLTKVAPRPDGSGVTADDVARAIEGSRRRLGRDVIDVYLLHWLDPSVPLEETWEALAQLVDRGLVRAIGLSNVGVDALERCAPIRHVDVLQLHASLLYRDELTHAAPACRRLGTGIVCYGPLAFGLLGLRGGASSFADWRGGAYGMEDFFVAENYARFFAPTALTRQLGRVRAVAAVAAELAITTAQAALAWLVAQPGVTGAIVGSRSAAHIAENVAAARLSLPPDALARVEAAVR